LEIGQPVGGGAKNHPNGQLIVDITTVLTGNVGSSVIGEGDDVGINVLVIEGVKLDVEVRLGVAVIVIVGVNV
jgi:hypothetical protein